MLNVPWGTVGPFGFQSTLLTHIELAINQNPQILFCRDAFQPLCACNLYVYPGLRHLRCRIWNLFLLNFIWLVTAQHS